MKKIIIVILSFFVFTPSIFAEGNIKEIQVDVAIYDNGNATITERWVVPKQSITYLEKKFSDVSDVTLTDISITSERGNEIKRVEQWDKNFPNTYFVDTKDDEKKILIAVDGEEDVYTITYTVYGFVFNFQDAQGIEWYFIPRENSQTIDTFKAKLISNFIFEASNTALYAIGSNNLDVTFENGAIIISSTKLNNDNPVKLMTTFNGIEFQSTKNRNYKFEERYNNEKNYKDNKPNIKKIVTNEVVIIIFIIFGAICAFIVGKVIYKALKKHDEYTGIEVENKNVFERIENADYYDATPCNGDLYEIAFIAGYFNILKNRSDLIGAILLKWDFENYIEIVNDSENPYIKIKSGQYFENSLDYDLYKILSACASQGYLAGSKLKRYAQEHYLRVMAWFNLGHHDAIANLLNRNKIIRVKKLKRYELVLQEEVIEDAVKLSGLKKYLLRFNQVPRKTKLTTEGYKYLLILAEMFGIGEQLSKEVLRKNPDNEMAKKLADLQAVKHIYKTVYATALAPYKQVVKDNGNISSYDPEIEKIINKEEDTTVTRKL